MQNDCVLANLSEINILLKTSVCSFLVFQELNLRAQGEVTIRDALRELDSWGATATFNLIDHADCNKKNIMLIKDWKDLVNSVSVKYVAENITLHLLLDDTAT